MIEKSTIEFSPKVVALFVLSLVIYIASSYYKTSNASALFDNRENNRKFAIKLSQSLHGKAGLVVANGNFDPIMPATLLKVLLRMPENEVASYQYDKNLIITTIGKSRVINISDIINYAKVGKSNNQYTIYLN
jgi:hypothetical protein